MIPTKLQNILDDLKSQDWINKLAEHSEIFIVGGTVRDAFTGKPMKDIDLIVDGLSYKGIKNILPPYGKLDLVGDSFSVIKFRPHGHVGEDFDIAVPREDKKVGDGHKGFEVNTDGVDIMDDLSRRDFTINSMAINVMTGELLDPFDGKGDLEKGEIKATNKTAFIEDPLRILRGIQFAARFDFDIESGTKALMKKNSDLIKEITGERILDEFQKILMKAGNTQTALRLIHETDVDVALFDKKMIYHDEGFDKLDPISFYYMLGTIGGQNPAEFYKKRLKGEFRMAKVIDTLDRLLTDWSNITEEEDAKYATFVALNSAPELRTAGLIPQEMENIIKEMDAGNIPSNPNDIKLNGNDIMTVLGIKGREVGYINERIRRDALMNKFDWSNREKSIEYLTNLIN